MAGDPTAVGRYQELEEPDPPEIVRAVGEPAVLEPLFFSRLPRHLAAGFREELCGGIEELDVRWIRSACLMVGE
jgi:hypothetical protein